MINVENQISFASEVLPKISQPDCKIWLLIPNERLRVNLFIFVNRVRLRLDFSKDTKDEVMTNIELAMFGDYNPLLLSEVGLRRLIRSFGILEPMDIFHGNNPPNGA